MLCFVLMIRLDQNLWELMFFFGTTEIKFHCEEKSEKLRKILSGQAQPGKLVFPVM